MAKRTRYQARSSGRPGGSRSTAKAPNRPAGAKPAPAPGREPEVEDRAVADSGLDDMPAVSAGHLTDAEIARAEALQAEAARAEASRAAIAESLRRAEGRARTAPGDVNAPLSVRMSHEYAYVARDVRRIIVTASIMFGILAILFVLQAAGVIGI